MRSLFRKPFNREFVNFKTLFDFFKGYVFVGLVNGAFFALFLGTKRRAVFKRARISAAAYRNGGAVFARDFVVNV